MCCFLLVFCSCFVPPFCYWFAPVMLKYWHPFGTVLVLYFVTLLGVSCEPLERVMGGFIPPHISRLPLGFSWVPLGLNAPHSLCSSFVRFKLHHHQNHIKTSSKIACILLAFWLLSKKHARKYYWCVWRGYVWSAACLFQNMTPSGGDIEKTGIAPGSFLCLWRLHGLCAVRWFFLPSWMDVDIPPSHSPPGSTPGASKCHTAWLWLYRYTHIQRILGT